MVTQHVTEEPSSLSDIKNHPNSVCIDCVKKDKNCSFATKVIHKKDVGKKYLIKYYIKDCSNKVSKK